MSDRITKIPEATAFLGIPTGGAKNRLLDLAQLAGLPFGARWFFLANDAQPSFLEEKRTNSGRHKEPGPAICYRRPGQM